MAQLHGKVHPPAAGGKCLAGHEAGILAQEEADDRGDLGRLADPAERRVGHDALHRLVRKHVGHLGLDQAGGHAVDAHVVRQRTPRRSSVLSAMTPALDEA